MATAITIFGHIGSIYNEYDFLFSPSSRTNSQPLHLNRVAVINTAHPLRCRLPK